MSRVEIRVGTVRDVSFVAANMRPGDRRELMCQLPGDVRMGDLAAQWVMTSDCWTVWVDGKVVAAFGLRPMNVAAMEVWAFGTKHMWRGVPALTAYMLLEVAPTLLELGYRTVEARSIEGHTEAHNWMRAIGAKPWGEPFEYGREGELFTLYRWTVPEYRSIRADEAKWKRRSNSYVFFNGRQLAEDPEATEEEASAKGA